MSDKKKVYVRNPESGRLISIKGKKGKEVIKKLKDENKDIDYIVRIKGDYKKEKFNTNQVNQMKEPKINQVKTNQMKEPKINQVKTNQMKELKINQVKEPKTKIRVKIIPLSNIHNGSHPNSIMYGHPESIGTILRFVQNRMRIL